MFTYFKYTSWGFIAAVDVVGSPEFLLVFIHDERYDREIPPFYAVKQLFIDAQGEYHAKT
jgi:hypothetical protein